MALAGIAATDSSGTIVAFGNVTLLTTGGVGPEGPAGADGYRPTFDVTRDGYGAVGDGVADCTVSIQAAFDAAKAVTDANASTRAMVWIPDGVFVCEGLVVGASTEDNRITVQGPGTLKMKDSSAEDYVLEVAGNECCVEQVTIDGNAAGSPSGRGEGLRVSGSRCRVSNVYAKNTKTTGSTGIPFADLGVGNTYEGCWSINSGYVGYRFSGDYALVRNCYSIDAASHGLSVSGGSHDSLIVDGFYESSPNVDNAGKSGILIDAGVSTVGGVKTGSMMKYVMLRNIRSNMAGGSYVGMKVARVHHLVVDGLEIKQGESADASVKIAEAIGRLTMKNAVVEQNIDQDPAGTATGSITDSEDNGGFVKFTSAAHTLYSNDYVVIKGTVSYDGMHLVTAADADTFTTNRKYVADDETGTYYECSENLDFENVTIGDGSQTIAGPFSGLRAQRLSFKRCELIDFRDYAIGLDNNLSTSGVFERIEIDGLRLETNDASVESAGPWVVAWNSGSGTQTGVLMDSNVLRVRNVEYVDNGTGLTRGVVGNTVPTKTLTASTTLSALDTGMTFMIGAADLAITLPNVASIGPGVRYTFVMESAGLSASTGLAISPRSTDAIALSGVSPGVVGKDIQLAGVNDAVGDCLTIVSDGALSWYVLHASGRWTIEDDSDVHGEQKIVITATGLTITPEQSGTCFVVAAPDQTFQLPKTIAGLRYTFFLGSAALSVGAGLKISPHAEDRIIMSGITAVEDKDLILAGSGDLHGDTVTLIGDGAAGWYVESVKGVWSRET